MTIEELQRNWDKFGEDDPFWAILTKPGTKGGRWNLREFFQTGEQEVAQTMEFVERGGAQVRLGGSAIDFGCGVGRLSQALCKYFHPVTGVDISPSMIRQAKALNVFGDKCEYVLNEADNLAIFANSSRDFIFSRLVLQHMNPKYSVSYLNEFMRILRPGAVAAFQLTEGLDYTPSVDPLSAESCRASFKVLEYLPEVVAGGTSPMMIEVTNEGDQTWPVFENGRPDIRLGNHWLDSSGALLRRDDARARISCAIPSGASDRLRLVIGVPSEPGEYIVEIDMVQEHVDWFARSGSSALRIPIKVLPSNSGVPFPAVNEPVMEMYGVPREEVIRVIEQASGEVLAIQSDKAAGSDWISLHYCVRRRV